MADNVVETILVKLGLDGSQYNAATDKVIKKNDTLNKSVAKTDKAVGTVAKTMGRWFAGIASATGLAKLIDEVQKLNDELYHLEKNLGMSATTIKSWQGAAAAMGGSASGMTNSMKSLNMQMNDFVIMGDTSMLPFMNALGVSMVDAQGKLRDTDKVMLDLADSFSKMDREQAFSLASKMGIDEGTFNTLVQGRQEMEKMIEYQKTMYKSSEEELKASRELAKNRALLGQHWESLKTMLANALIPFFVKLSEVALGMFDYLQKHQRAIQAVFKGLAFVIGVVLTPILIKAAAAALAFIAPFAPFILVVTALGAAFGLLYDDYKTWAEGGNSLFNWGAFRDYIDNAKFSVDNLKQGFAFLLTGYTTWAEAASNGREWLKLKGFIQDNEVSVNSLTNGFKNLAREVLNDVIPTLKGYASIITKIFSGDFRGALAEAKEMGTELWNRTKGMASDIWNRAGGAVDIATGQNAGTAAAAASSVVSSGGTSSKNRKFTFGGGVDEYIAESSKKYGIPEDVLRGFVKMEAGWTGKMSPTGAIGTGQFIQSTWNGLAATKEGKEIGMTKITKDNFRKSNDPRYDKRINTLATGLLAKKNADMLKAAGLPVTGENLYMMHNIGQGVIGALKGGKVSDATDLAMRQNGKRSGETAAQFAKRQQGNYQRHYDVANAEASMRQGANTIPSNMQSMGRNVRNDVNIGDINVYTSASTIKGTTTDAMTAATNQLGMLMPSMA